MTPPAQISRVRRDQLHFHFDSKQPPVLSVKSGERVIFETEDAHCGSIRSESFVYKSLAEVFQKLGGANPVSGPVFVEGAKAGGCIAVEILSIKAAPVWGHGYTVLTPGLGGLVSSYTLMEPLEPRTIIAKVEDGQVKLPAKRGIVSLPLHPFLGTIGVAPAGERRLSYYHHPEFLGNVDCPDNGAGATLVLPANVDGALLSMGDAHAVQGDGEITGAAIEIQADVEVRVTAMTREQAKYADLPQVNTPDFIGSIAAFGGVNLGDTVRAAYIDLVKRLERYCGFSRVEAYEMVGQVGSIRIGQVVDPLYAVVAKIERRFIE